LPDANSLIPARTPLRDALFSAALFASITFLIHFVSSLWGSHLGYGFFRDELYYLVCGHHLAFGYVDQPPLIALQARLAEILFGLSPTGIRIFSFLATGLTVGLTGLLAWQLGGRRSLQLPFHERLGAMLLDGLPARRSTHRRRLRQPARVDAFRSPRRSRH
jgi:hypothetical protein